MGASSNSNTYYHRNAWRINNSKKLWTDYLKDYFDVYIVSNKAQGFSYAHHYLLLKNGGSWFRVAEWCQEDAYNGPCYMFACKVIRYHKCRYLGNYKLREIVNAIEFANEIGENDYNRITYNCNHWVEKVAKYLGENIEVSRNCDCIEDTLYKTTIT